MAPPKKPWFRWYCETMGDLKLRRLPPDQRWVWAGVLSLARSSPIAGHLMLSDSVAATIEDVAEYCGVPVKTARQAVDAFTAMGMLTVEPSLGCLMAPKFAERQYESDDSNARSKRHRSNGDATVHQLPINGDTGSMQRPQRQTQRTETENRSDLHHPVTDRPADCNESVGRVLDIAAQAIYRSDPDSCRKEPGDYVRGIRANMLAERLLEAQLALSNHIGDEVSAAAEMVGGRAVCLLAAMDLGYTNEETA